jgi:hypothetical protein
LAVILATEAAKAVIFRRGPSYWVQLILWDTRADTFAEGQWFKGRIYPERCDLSPDGSKLVYFAAKHYRHLRPHPSYEYAWTAISKPPYYTALALLNQDTTYGGGGYFVNNHTVCVCIADFRPAHKDHLPPESLYINPESCEQNADRWFWRLKQNGWEVISKAVRRSYSRPAVSASVLHRDSRNHKYRLIMNDDSTILTYSVVRKADEKEFLVSDTWADWDHRGRLVYVEEGKLYAGRLGTDEIEPQLLADFNPNRPKLIKAPEWATTWP